MKHFYYLAPGERIVRIAASLRPSPASAKRNVKWSAQEFNGDRWFTPALSRVLWEDLSKLKYIGWTALPKAGVLTE